MKRQSVFILYERETADPKQYYAGGGCYGIEWVNRRLETVRVRYASGRVSPELIEQAKQYIAEEMTDRLNVRVEVLDD